MLPGRRRGNEPSGCSSGHPGPQEQRPLTTAARVPLGELLPPPRGHLNDAPLPRLKAASSAVAQRRSPRAASLATSCRDQSHASAPLLLSSARAVAIEAAAAAGGGGQGDRCLLHKLFPFAVVAAIEYKVLDGVFVVKLPFLVEFDSGPNICLVTPFAVLKIHLQNIKNKSEQRQRKKNHRKINP